MLERQIALEKAQGYRGPATRFFSEIDSLESAELALRDATVALAGLALIWIIWPLSRSSYPLLSAALIAVPAFVLMLWRHPAAAVILFLVSIALPLALLGLRAIPGIWGLLFFVLVFLLASRASRATFKRRQFLRSTSSSTEAGA